MYNSAANQSDAIVADPAWLPYRLLDGCRTLKFVHLPREILKDLPFLDKRAQPWRWEPLTQDAPRALVPLAEMVERSRTADSGPCHFIFHSAFCCSTLMSRALDIEGVACVLGEPRALRELAEMNLAHDQRTALDVVLDLMRRPRLPDETTIIKPHNRVNPLIDYIMERQPDSRALLMYTPLVDFLLAIARSRRRWLFARSMAAQYRDHLEFETPETGDLVYLTDLQMAAFLWLQQQALFARVVRRLPQGRVATLRADVFVARPTEAVAAAAALFELPLGQKEVAAITAGPLFHDHSKRPGESFEESNQKRTNAMVKLAFGPEIEQAIEWGEKVAAEASVPMELQAALIS
jgi:hypothetical protein